MTKTFKSPLPDSSYKFEIGKNVGAEHLFAWISGGGVDSISMALAPSDAPALALAILEAAGYTEDDTEGTTGLTHFALAMSNLRTGIEEQERATAEARELAELEAEALELCNAHRKAERFVYDAKWDDLNSETKANWLAVARRAREMRAEK